ncbi:hypothetical protein ACFQY0_04610 [Haloferula chungangensis]|uniref:Type II secretion system protein GspG C-terminal domain-containing protein n=1 Tax=Haloferula chungangensis TaxID=1048331 RepID=A0ABW2L5L8_9BACT
MAEKKKRSLGRWVLVAGILLLLVAVWYFSDSTRAVDRAKRIEGLVLVNSLVKAVENFQMEYDRLPDIGAVQIPSDGPAGEMFLGILTGAEESQRDLQNLRSIVFLQGKEAKDRKGGLVYGPDDRVKAIYDPFGNPYMVILNAKKEDSLVFQYGDQNVMLRGKGVAAYSPGKDGKLNTPDDIRSWN